jgi:hypothetical protein
MPDTQCYPFSRWPRDLRAEIARNIVAPFRAFAPVDLCDQAERDIVDVIPSRAGYFDARQGAKCAEPEFPLRKDSVMQLALFGGVRSESGKKKPRSGRGSRWLHEV